MEEVLTTLGKWVVAILAIGAIVWIPMWRQAKKLAEFREVTDTSIGLSRANTKAIEENTAAIRELIRKLDEQKV